MSYHPKNIRILLVGEPQTGKTSLVLSLVSEEFTAKVPAQAEEITIPADVTPERVPTQIVDYSSRTQSQDELNREIRRADVICLVHALDDPKSLERLSSFWLPLIRRSSDSPEVRTPVVLVGNKLDLVTSSQLESVLSIMTAFSEVETCIECSAKTLLNLSETFWFAQKAVLYPTAPLYSAEKKELAPDCVRALTRIFRICDTDNDGYLSDRELEAFQSRCFSVPLTAQSLQDVKQLVRQSCTGGVALTGLTQRGFLFLHLIFIQKGRHETTWTVLRQFGYDNRLRLSGDFVSPRFTVPSGCSTEISPLGFHFLQALFNKYDLDRDGCLSPAELSELLATCPTDDKQQLDVSCLADCVSTNSIGWITRQGFLAYWFLTAYRDPSQALEYFAYLGFTYFAAASFWSNTITTTNCGDIYHDLPGGARPFDEYNRSSTSVGRRITRSESGFQEARDALLRSILITPEKRLDAIRRSTNRTVFYCRVYGARNVGKTCLLQGLLGRHLRGSGGHAIGGRSGRASKWAAGYGIPVCGQLRTLLLHEIDAVTGEKMTAMDALSADVACLVYDVCDPESFRYAANLFLQYYHGTRVPCLFVASKSDQPYTVQNYPIEPEELTVKYNLSPPHHFSSILLGQQLEDHERQHLFYSRASDTSGGGMRKRADSADPLSSSGVSHPLVDDGVTMAVGDTSDRGFAGFSTVSPGFRRASHEDSELLQRGRQQLSPTSANSIPGATATASVDSGYFCPVYIQLCTLANYPHLRGLQLSSTDHAWKWTLAATILAGFGFVAFRIARTHF